MPLRSYEGPGQLQIDGQTIAEAETVRVNIRSNNNRVYTMLRQFAGRSKGPTETEISIDNAIPRAGFEIDFTRRIVADADVRVTVLVGGQRLQFDGYIDDVALSQGVQEMARASITIAAGPPTIL